MQKRSSVTITSKFPEPFVPLRQDTPPDTSSVPKLRDLRTEVMAMTSFITKQFSLIKQNHMFHKEQSQLSITNESSNELMKSLLQQIEYMRGENASKNSFKVNFH